MTQNTVLACLCAALLMSCTTPEPDTTDFVKCLENNLIEAFGTDAVQQQFDAYGQFIQFYYSDTEVIRLYAQLTDQYRLSGQTVAPDSLRKVIALRQKSLDYLKLFSAITDSTRIYWQKSVEYCQNEILYHNWIIDNRHLDPSVFQRQILLLKRFMKKNRLWKITR